MWPANLSVRLRVVALVSRYLTNKLIRNRLLPDRRTFENQLHAEWLYHLVLPALSGSYPKVRGTLAIHYSPVRHCVLLHRATCMS